MLRKAQPTSPERWGWCKTRGRVFKPYVIMLRIEEFHRGWMKQASEMAEEAEINIPTVPRMYGIQMHRENIRAVTPDEYYCQTGLRSRK